MQIHYVCSECGYTSSIPGTCQNEECIRQGMPLSECHCQDNMHRMVLRIRVEGDNLEEEKREAEENEYATNTLDLDNDDEQA
jgi:hypothetical protein